VAQANKHKSIAAINADLQKIAEDHRRWKKQEERLRRSAPTNGGGVYVDPLNNRVHYTLRDGNDSAKAFLPKDEDLKSLRSNKTNWLGLDKSPAVVFLYQQVNEICSVGRSALNA
jgi:hypothetical protein